MRFASTESEGRQDRTLDDYIANSAETQDKIYYLLAEAYATAAASPHLEGFVKKGIEVLLLTDRIDPWLVDSLGEYAGKELADVARADLDLPEGAGKLTPETQNEEHKALLKKIKRVLRDKVEAVNVSARLVDSPACVVSAADALSPQMRRMLEATGQTLPDAKPILEINVEHPLISRLASEADEARFDTLTNIVYDHALLAEGAQLEKPGEYVRRMNEILLELDSGPATG